MKMEVDQEDHYELLKVMIKESRVGGGFGLNSKRDKKKIQAEK
jgi:hypothetical protein